jgi:hypothetical protein
MNSLFIRYDGYTGDANYGSPERLLEKAPSAKAVGTRYFYWLSRMGFGPGYYALFLKLNFKGEIPVAEMETLQKMFSLTVYSSKEEYDSAKVEIANFAKHQKRMRKQNPY